MRWGVGWWGRRGSSVEVKSYKEGFVACDY